MNTSRLTVEFFLRKHLSPDCLTTLSISLQDMELHAGEHVQKAEHVFAQLKEQMMEVWANCEQTFVDKQ